MNRWMLTLTLHGSFGERYAMAVEVAPEIAQEIVRIDPEPLGPIEFGTMNMDTMVKILRRKVMRKDLFREEARRLGVLLAERMEDAEGWHDESRIEPAKRQLSK